MEGHAAPGAGGIAQLSPEQRALLIRLLEKKGAVPPAVTPPPPIPRRPPGAKCPASLDQERLWFLHLMDPRSAAYNVDIPMRLRGEIEMPPLVRALNEIVRRHEAWRTTFAAVDGEPVQIVAPALTLPVPVVDWRGVYAAAREPELLALLEAEIRRPFDLERGPLVRFTVLRLGPAHYVLVLVVHHIVTDWISMKRFWMELLMLYQAFAAGRPSPLPEPPLQYADFAVWQRQWLAEGGLAKHMEYWRAHLAEAPLVLELPTDRPRPPVQTGRGLSSKLALSRELSDAVRRLSQRLNASPFMTLMAAYKALLLRYTGQERIILGSPSANRNRPELEPVLGFFLTQLVLCTDLAGDPTFIELVGRERQVALGAYAHQDVPFSLLLKELQLARDLSRPPVVQATFFVLEQADHDLPNHQLEVLVLEDGAARWDLTLFFWDNKEKGFNGWFEYDVDLFDVTTVARMGESFTTLLAAALANQETRLSDLPWLSETQRHQLLAEWAGESGPDGQARQPVHELFAAQAARTPAATAVACGAQRLTYRELDRRANQLAHRLRRLGVGPESRVMICAERSLDLPVAILGTLKAGGAFVPVDPAHPDQRLELLAQDSGAAVLLTQAGLAGRLAGAPCPRLCLDAEWGEIAAEPPEAPLHRASPSDLAYLIYTSGSTGAPKAVLVEHGNLAATLAATRELFGGEPGDRAPVLASAAFDIFLFELFQPLLCGGTALLVPLQPAPDVDELLELLAGAAWFHAVPSLMRQIVDQAAARPHGFPVLRRVFVGGDAVPAELLADLARVFPRARVQVLYGPTEAAIVCAGHAVPRGQRQPRALVGRPFPGTVLRLADAAGREVPVGVAGELWIGGAAVGRGYLNQPQPTAERFVRRGEARYFRSGDRMRYLADGNLEFLGRLDQQVKVRGFRVELPEIEAVLGSLPRVGAAAVVALADRGREKRLVAYVVAKAGAAPAAGELRAALKERVPEYMIPSAFVMLPALPLTATGKVDRAALPAPSQERPALAGSYLPPRNATEERLAAIWSEALGIESVGIEDNFFELGGDSILSIQVVSRARQAGLALNPRLIFQHPTVAALAAMIDTVAPPAAEQGPVTGPVPLTPVQRQFLARDLARPQHWNQSLLLETDRALPAPRLAAVVQALLLQHDVLRHRFLPGPGDAAGAGAGVGAEWRQVASEPAAAPAAPCGFVDLAPLPAPRRGGEIEAVSARLQGSLDLERGPVFRAAAFGLGAGAPGRLLLVAHHLVMDFFSWRPLLEDFETAWRLAERGEAIALPAKTGSFKSWAEGLVEQARSPAVAAELPYWLDERRRWAPRLAVDWPAGRDTVGGARTLAAELPPETTRALLDDVPAAARLEVQDVLLAALARVMARRSGSRLLAVDCEGYGRDVLAGVDLERTAGWFAWTWPLLLDLGAAADLGAELKAVKERLRGVPNRGLGYGLLRFLAADPETAARFAALPEPEIAFQYVGGIGRLAPRVAGLRLAPERPGAPVAAADPRAHRLEIHASLAEERLRVTWTYGEEVFRRETIEALAASFLAEVQAIVDHCRASRLLALTPADFPLAALDQESLDALLGGSREIEDLYPLTPLQQGMLFHSLHAPEQGLYVNQTVWELGGDLDLPAFLRAWQEVVDRHPVLRTGFVWEGVDRPLQRVHRTAAVPYVEHDWRDLARPEVEARLAAFLAEDRRRGFELPRPPLMRLASMLTAGGGRIFIWSNHHLLLDGWCLSLIFGEVQSGYQAVREGRGMAAPRPRPFRDYIAWLARQDLAEAEAYWRRRLDGFTAPTPVHALRPAAAGAVGESEERRLFLEPRATAALAGEARRRQLTLNTLVQGAWAAWLSCHSGEDDVVFGITVSGRPASLPGVETMVGMFLNSLPVRVRLAPRDQLLPWLAELQEQLLQVRQHEHTPLADVQRWSALPAGQPLFDTLSVFENHPVDPAVREQRPGLAVRSMRTLEKTQYPITLTVVPGDRLMLTLIHDAARLDRVAALRMLAHLAAVLEAMGAGLDGRLEDLPRLLPAERHQAIVEWNDTGSGSGAGGPWVHEWFSRQAARSPQAPALVCGTRRWTYHELDVRSGRLARELRRRGVGPEVKVALCLARSPELVAAMLAVWKAGGAYVPLDLDHPTERLACQLRDCRPALVLTHSGQAGALPPAGVPVVALDGAGWPAGADAAAADATAGETAACETAPAAAASGSSPRAVPGAAAYVIYTSGSTGEPKGVVVEHGGLANLAAAQIACFALAPGSRVQQFAPPSVDAAVAEIVTALCSGATLYLDDKDALLPGPNLVQRLRDRAITHVTLPPAALAALPAAELPALATLVVAGEACPPALAARWTAAGRGHRLLNAYGPTEASVCATVAELAGGGEVSIGRPLPGVAVYVVDRHLRQVPAGIPGELCIGGAGVARGYLERPRATAAQFVPDPFSGRPGARLYRSGDLARFRPDGRLDFLGRIDHQVKVRGFRVELGEVETVLGRCPLVAAAAAALRDGGGEAGQRLVAWVVPRPGAAAPLDAGELRAFLRERLPDPMVPASFVVVEALPLTAAGKVDRRALPAPEPPRAPLGRPFAAPRSAAEERLAAIWSQVLRVPRVGIHDNFFDLGGDSILSLQIVSRAARAGLAITPRQVFQHQTVAALAAAAGASGAAAHEQGLVTGPVPLTPIQRWFFEQELPDPRHFNQAVQLDVPPGLDLGVLAAALRLLVAHHDALRLRARRDGSGWRQHVAGLPDPASCAAIDLRAVPPAVRDVTLEAAAKQLQSSLDLERGPLLRAACCELGPGAPKRLLLTVHHLAVDAVSWRILIEDLDATCRQLAQGAAAQLPPKTTSFRRWAERLAEHARSAALAGELPFWLALGGEPAAPLPCDLAAGPNDLGSARTVSVALDAETTRALLREVPPVYRTEINDVLLTALARSFAAWTGRRRLLVDLEGHGREDLFPDVDLSRTVGWFTTSFPVLLDLGPDRAETGRELMRIKERLRAVPRRGIGYGMLRYLGDAETRARLRALPAAEVGFNYLGQMGDLSPDSSPLRAEAENLGPAMSPRSRRAHLVEVNARVAGDQLRVAWTYSGNCHLPPTIERLAQDHLEALRLIVIHCQSPGAGGATHSDFPLAQLGAGDLDRLLQEVEFE